MIIPDSKWSNIPGYSDSYLVSEYGAVYSSNVCRILKPARMDSTGHLGVKLRTSTGDAKSTYIHQLVLVSFVGARPEEMVARHLDSNPVNNHFTNLAWGTHSENMQDIVDSGLHKMASKKQCIRGHEFFKENTGITKKGHRYCRSCKDAHRRAYMMNERFSERYADDCYARRAYKARYPKLVQHDDKEADND